MLAALKHLFKLQFLIILVAIFAGVYFQEIIGKIKSTLIQQNDNVSVKFYESSGNFVYPKEALAKFVGETEDQPIYLSLLGSVYDVTKGRKHYGPGCSYSYFAGRDASKSFVTGEFTEFNETSDDVMSLSPKEILSLYDWKKFYDKEYVFKGFAEGRFYKKNGEKTEYLLKLDAIAEQALLAKLSEKKLEDQYPQCNIEWSEEKGTRVWCTEQSGGIRRDWKGVPRKYFEPGKDSYRCACIQKEDLDLPHFQPYENCDPQSHSCFYNVD